MDPKRLIEILEQNRDKEFVRRILTPGQYPVLWNKDGSHSTHSMAWDGPDPKTGRSVVYPTVVRLKDGRMVRLDDRSALGYAIENNEIIPFDDPQEAETFSKQYKQWWDQGYRQPE
jgi:hypothetical protein